jgi:hypothetical protein
VLASPSNAVIRVGVTGHRHLADPEAVRRECIAAVVDLRRKRDAATVEIWSSLAEGADRIAAHLVPAHAEQLSVVLPLDAVEYRRDFATDRSLTEFDELLAAAQHVEVTGPDPDEHDIDALRESAYERAGLAIVERCDVLLALWDGQPSRGRGGTAEIVEVARERERHVIHVPVTRATP